MYKQLLMLLLLVNTILWPSATVAVTREDIEAQYEALKAAASRSGAWATVIKDNLEMTGTAASLTVASVEKLKKSLIKDQLNLLQEIAQKKYDLAGLVTSAEDIEKTINAAQGNSSIYTAIYEGNLTNVKKNMETATERLTSLAKEYQLKVAAGETADEIAEVAGDVTSSAGKLGKFMEVTGKFFDGLDIAVSLGEGGWHLIQGTSSKEDVDKIAATVVKVGFPAFGLYSAYADITGMTSMLDQFYEDVRTRAQGYQKELENLVKSTITDGENFKELSHRRATQFRFQKLMIEGELDAFLSGVQTVSIFAALNIVLSGKQEPYSAIIRSLKELLYTVQNLDSDQLLFQSYAIGLEKGMYNKLKEFEEPAENLSELEQMLNELVSLQEEYDREQTLAPFSSTPVTVFKLYQDASGQVVATFSPSGEINGDVSLERGTLDLQGQELVINGNLIHSGGDLKVNGGRLIVKGDYHLQNPDGAGGYGVSQGYLLMTQPEDYVYVGGNFVTQSDDSSEENLTAGTLEVKGDFMQKGVPYPFNVYNNFVGRDTHKVVLSSTKLQTVSFDSPGTSHFASLDITNTGEGIQFATRVVVSTLFNHRGHPFTLSPNATPADFADYDNDGLTGQVDPMPTSFNNLDTDQDGVVDELDAFPTDATEWADQDKDGIGDNVDDDNDNDGMTDAWERVHGLNPADPNDANLPSTTEGLTNLQLFQQTQAILNSQPSFAFLGQATAKNTQGEAIVTGAKLIGGLATDQTKYRKNQTVQLSDPVTVAGLIAAETGHINQPAEIVVYAAYTPLSAPDSPPLYFMLDSHSGIQLWDENVKTLVAFQSVAALEDVAEIKMYQGPFPAAGFLKIYFGYRSPDGMVVVNGEPIEVKVTE